MTVIQAADVKELREVTGAGMMDCKKALAETGGDKEAAIDLLRAKGLSKAAKKSDRVAAEGVVAVSVKNGKAVIAEIDAETLGEMNAPCGSKLSEKITAAIASIGENIKLRRAAFVKGEVMSAYVHNKVTDNAGKIGVLVALEGVTASEEAAQIAKQIAMHIAAAAPTALNAQDIPASVIDRERAVYTEQAKESGKPDNIIAGMVEGKMKKYFKEVCLNEQSFIMDPDKSVSEFVKTLGANAKISQFVMYRLGEGIEKQTSDFAAEVAAAASA
jgi:elongation factor Ts